MITPVTDTPRTTALMHPSGAMSIEILEHARTLERELTAMTGNASQYKAELDCIKQTAVEMSDSNRVLLADVREYRKDAEDYSAKYDLMTAAYRAAFEDILKIEKERDEARLAFKILGDKYDQLIKDIKANSK